MLACLGAGGPGVAYARRRTTRRGVAAVVPPGEVMLDLSGLLKYLAAWLLLGTFTGYHCQPVG